MYPPIKTDQGEFVFRDHTGQPLNLEYWVHRRLRPIAKQAGLGHIHPHLFRHFYASLVINAGEQLTYKSRQLGHSSIKMTCDVYGHLFRTTGQAAMERLGRLIPDRQSVPMSQPYNSHVTKLAETRENTMNQDRQSDEVTTRKVTAR
jgi:Phage integrase family